MNYETARQFLIDQGTALETKINPDAFLMRLEQGKPPIPGQATNILLALKISFEMLQGDPLLDRELVAGLYLLAMESLKLFEAGRRKGVMWPPLLKEDIERISIAVKNIFSGVWPTDK
ncbi:MAG: Dethiobiotin synthetase [Okeania sp. SIO2C2]|uniref:Dethiobiotin synthetase n=1 Tax=Okeania sp. SIO2C2 TaxID=2607787 RepID=UPI0013BA8B5A|nr:Dethiobiotin synthetase [Okeania sp. SIO2C2]NEP88322.1 Dethiobiotin synthetase [Okeania sp. SIO2C2]